MAADGPAQIIDEAQRAIGEQFEFDPAVRDSLLRLLEHYGNACRLQVLMDLNAKLNGVLGDKLSELQLRVNGTEG